ncbi:DUF5330 domain-containing protein [Jiella avicenniae]|uniref:DUF5330 domain-containing protein n=1 Tax=Jiella avicenniae TaxID=2907202 RepID=A0A9X1T9R3_9HYPH|nr:DUF5330 domain-containing protein [Jiella avicenniae]MCE7026578.1 DUF5330 domain-containing protein [Jiella avicenniae]
MIRFVIKVGFFLGLIALVVPREDDGTAGPPINPFALLYGAQAAVSDLSNFCERAPSACAAGGDVARFAGERVAEGLAIAYGFVGSAVSERRGAGSSGGPVQTAGTVAAEPRSGSGDDAPVTASPARTDAVTTAAISARAPAMPHVAIPRDRALDAPAGAALGQRVVGAGRLPKVESRPLQTATRSDRPAKTVPVPVPAPRT